jgi:hypothetical protein
MMAWSMTCTAVKALLKISSSISLASSSNSSPVVAKTRLSSEQQIWCSQLIRNNASASPSAAEVRGVRRRETIFSKYVR